MLIQLVVLSLLAVSHAAPREKVSYHNYKVFKVIPQTKEHASILDQFEEKNVFSYWSRPTALSQAADVMVPPSKLMEFYEIMNYTNTKYHQMIENVQTLIEKENTNTLYKEDFDWESYHTLSEIYTWMEEMQQKYPKMVQVIEMGRSHEGLMIKGAKVTFGENKPGIFIEGGIHAREWISPATVTYLMNEMITSKDENIRRLAEAHEWYFVPSFNPDGYVYTHEYDRLWRKTRSGSGLCKGADPNRNWGYKWMGGGASQNPCMETYAGKQAFSEIETKSMSEYILSIKDRLFAYVAFHSYSQLLMFPYGHTTKHLDNHKEEKLMGTMAIEALRSRYGTKYVTGNIAETIYVASGSSMDWVKATLKLPVTFTYELRDTGRHGFLLPADQIIPNGQEVMDSLIAMFKEATRLGYPKPE